MGELAAENSVLIGQRSELLKGLAEMFPGEGWKDGPHPELGDMPEELAPAILSKISNLNALLKASEEARLAGEQKLAAVQQQEKDTRAAARVAIASAVARNRALREFMEPDSFARLVTDATKQQYESADSLPEWDDLPEQTQKNVIAVCVQLQEQQAQAEDEAAKALDKIAEEIMDEGEELVTALRKIAEIKTILQAFWDHGVLDLLVRPASRIGMDFLPPGTIVHNAHPSVTPHRPY